MTTKLVHLTDVNGFYTEDYLAHDSAREPGVYQIPECGTELPLPTYSTNQWPQLINGAWTVVPSYIGETWYDQTTNEAVVINSHGQPASNLAPTQTSTYLASVVKQNFKNSAQAALSKSDITISRCVESSVAVPANWSIYRKALRAIVNGTDTTSTTLPTIPAYPSGT